MNNNFKRIGLALIKYIFASIIMLWLVFWYISGSAMGLPRFVVTYYIATQKFMTPVSKATLFDGMLKGLVASLGEPHSVYLDKDDFESMKEHTSGTYAGVGMVLGHGSKGLEAVSVIDDMPAYKAGIKSGDHIVCDVTIVVERDNQLLTFNVTREEIVLPTVKSKMLSDHIGYIRISQFAEHTAGDFKTQYEQLLSEGMTSLVLDLRDNPGGLLNSAQDIASIIMPEGTLVSFTTRDGKTKNYVSDGKNPALPMVVLINKGSASASEIIAGAIQDRKLGTIVGTNSYGKGTVQSVYPNLEDEGIKVTIAKYHTPNDRVIDGTGIQPDVVLELPKGTTPSSDMSDIQIQKAIELLK